MAKTIFSELPPLAQKMYNMVGAKGFIRVKRIRPLVIDMNTDLKEHTESRKDLVKVRETLISSAELGVDVSAQLKHNSAELKQVNQLIKEGRKPHNEKLSTPRKAVRNIDQNLIPANYDEVTGLKYGETTVAEVDVDSYLPKAKAT